MSDHALSELPVNGVLDLHAVNPKDVRWLVPEYLRLCRERGILSVRIIHGKGRMVLLTTVHAILDKLPIVSSYKLADEAGGGWGATLVEME